jgi:5-methylcytosine-specific restriction endonuclease McrA
MDAAARERVRQRAGNRCEYCRLSQSGTPYAAFHVEHIIARQHGGSDDEDNLAWACRRCNFHKGPNLAGIDPATDEIVPLFHPRRDAWDEHFALRGGLVVGLTPVGRTTVRLLRMNLPARLDLRARMG